MSDLHATSVIGKHKGWIPVNPDFPYGLCPHDLYFTCMKSNPTVQGQAGVL